MADGQSIHSYRWVKFFAEQGHAVTWASLSPSQFEPLKNVTYVQLTKKGWGAGLIVSIWRLRALIRRSSFDAVHVHSVGTYGLLGFFSGSDRIVATPWGSDVIYGKNSLFKRPFIVGILKSARLITCDAWHMRDQVMELGVGAERIQIINFGIDSVRFSPPSIDGTPDPARSPMVISLRNFEPVYDISTLLRAIPLVLRVHPAVRFTIVGRGSLAEELKAQAQRLGIHAAVQFIGFVPNDQLPELLRKADVYVSTSLSDAGIAASTAEAMACGRAVVITDSGENGKWVTDGINGFLVPVSQPEILAERISRLLSNADLRHSFGAAARAVIMERNDYTVEMTKMQWLYKTLETKP